MPAKRKTKAPATSKAPAKKAKAAAVASSTSGPYKQTQIIEYLSEKSELSKKEVKAVMEALRELMHLHLKKRGGIGEFTLPGLLKVVKKIKPATKARQGTNPFTGEPMVFKAKPKRVQLKIKPLKKLKEMAE